MIAAVSTVRTPPPAAANDAAPALAAPAIKDELPLAPVQAFSIDDSHTTEIDDALSVNGLGSGEIIFGVHIAAPALAIAPDSPIDKVARERLSTVYMPGHKLTMLPDAVVQAYTLIEGRDCPAVSVYFRFDEATLALNGAETRIERVPIAANLRHDQLDEVVTESALTGDAVADYPFAQELAFCFRMARHLKAQREVVRGKPENFNRPDYNFRLDGNDGEPGGDRNEHVAHDRGLARCRRCRRSAVDGAFDHGHRAGPSAGSSRWAAKSSHGMGRPNSQPVALR